MPTFSDIVDAGVITDDDLWSLAHYVRSLSPEDERVFNANWSACWDTANESYAKVGVDPAWRCGGMVFTLNRADISYKEIQDYRSD